MDRPFIHINCASTLDGKIAKPDGSRLRISGPWDLKRVHKARADLGAILVGAGTILADDPKLTVKEEFVPSQPPLCKIILDGQGRIPASSRFLRTLGRSLIFTSRVCDKDWLFDLKSAVEEEDLDVEIIEMETTGIQMDLIRIMKELHSREVLGVIVEGGSDTIWGFVEQGLFDKFTIYYGPILIGGKGPTIVGGFGFMEYPVEIEISNHMMTEDGGILVELNKKNGSQ